VSEFIEFDNADIVTPDGRCLVRALSVVVQPREHLLVTGPNTSGKSSLIRVLEDLWPLRNGYVSSPRSAEGERISGLFLVPQVGARRVFSLSALHALGLGSELWLTI
jgi:ABC-type uncharacterized transport system fused permease/ATPase subunit